MVNRLLHRRAMTALIAAVPISMASVRYWLLRDNAAETTKDSWQRLRRPSEAPRYRAVRELTERYARDGFVLDIGCSQGILPENLRYGRYLGVDAHADSIRRASAKADRRTAFVVADGATFVADEPVDAVVFNEVLYYLADPLGAVQHYSRQLSEGGVVIVSIFARPWSSRRLLRSIGSQMEQLESSVVTSGQLAWAVAAYRPKQG